MTFKNLCEGRELAGDLLRQRRDFYAISLGLILFHLAGGVMKDTATLSTLPATLAHPQVLYWSAWVSFAYFAWRYSVLVPDCGKRFREEWRRQARASHTFHLVCLRWARRCTAGKAKLQRLTEQLAHSRPELPDASEGVRVDLDALWSLYTGELLETVNPHSVTTVEKEDIPSLRIARLVGFIRAIFLERTASDLILPYVTGAAAIAVAIITTALGHSV